MAWIDPRAEEYLRRRFTRADAYRFAPPGTPEATPPGWLDPSATRVRLKEAQEEEARAQAAAEELAFEAEVRDMRTLVGHLKSYMALRRAAQRSTSLWPQADRALERFNLAYTRYFGEDKAGFNPNQPRSPKGNPDGGRWIRDAGKEGADESLRSEDAALRRGGHHYVARQVYKNRNLSNETRKVFEDATTGTLADKTTNVFSKPHRNYNKAVHEVFDRFLEKSNITEEQMTPDHARQMLKDVVTSNDPRIRNFNLRIMMREIFRLPRFRGNE